ncbi:hypothetical protein [Nocardiopsis metallicus]|uniref:Uncharacterized protein n=1 Tax=Nocardiopsis metallicus TaxID=179819 RepID=A0A840WSV1_9ACTN|nr:hypothetical protein [Nocardiopsis metallicus]MBB5495025.1 hypothetical protein [Nocardiopsis metallicus]
MAVGRGVTDEGRVVFQACAPEELPGVVATVVGAAGLVVLVREGAPVGEVMADARLLLDEVRLVALRGWLDGCGAGAVGRAARQEA